MAESGSAERLFFFADAVVAIAITLLALELPVPQGDSVAAFRSSVRDGAGDYLAFLVSFLVIAQLWSQHHAVLVGVQRGDARLRVLTLSWLFTIVLVPFATKLLTISDLPTHGYRFGFYALLLTAASAAFLGIVVHTTRMPPDEIRTEPQIEAELASTARWRCYGILLGFGVSVPLFFVWRHAWVCWIVGPLLIRELRRQRLRRSST